ncbi:primosomal protein N' [Candidatus Tisiphia endosymbiont of Melanophora roralis]|uniref:primosomal protein N' n=1 Tax=Candidatus Tisiphia endosymbiont of Melanophora roralis TaxID=3066261 RepID=UPI001E7373B1|nr:MAG: primosomal protein N' [Rickettsia endosymbiont of Cimex lectularius]
MQVAKILLPLAKLFPLDYLIPNELKLAIGDLVVVPFRNKELTGIVWQLDTEVSEGIIKIKSIKQKVPLEFRFNQEILDLIKWAANYYMTSLGSVAKLALPIDIAQQPIKIKHQELNKDFILPTLSIEQQEALSLLSQSDKPSIIKGVTGSGKTEIYFHLLADYLKQGNQILIMLPEIALSQQIINRFIARFGFQPVIWNSVVTKAQKKMILRGLLNNEIKVIIGARSSLFLPYSNLGLIIIDEEHDSSYKQDDGILYNARDVAVLRGSLSKIKVVLCSATPSIETLYNVSTNKYQLIELSNRYQEATLPEIQIIDMKKEKLSKNSYLSKELIALIGKKLASKEQVLLFLNRRGYAPVMLCKLCGYRFTCNSCSAWLVVHKSSKKLECHHCGYQSRIHIFCPDCREEDSLTVCGPGIERIEEETRHLFPDSKIAVISKDYAQKPEKIRELLYKMEHSEIDILIGTQMITKGYHFPNLTLVGVVDADLGAISSGDLRSSERNYQLLHQVGGRAGREDKKGLVLMQTYYPDNAIFSYIKNGGDQFLQYELETRQAENMPPFTKMASIILSGKNEHKVLEISKTLVAIAPKSSARILGPSSALMFKLAGKFRYRILIIVDRKFNLQKFLQTWLSLIKIPAFCHLKVDIDPKSFY